MRPPDYRAFAAALRTSGGWRLRRIPCRFFKDPGRPIATERKKRQWRDTLRAIDALKAAGGQSR